MVAQISQQAAAENWSRLETALALVVAGASAAASEVMQTMEHARLLMPAFAALHADALDFYFAGIAVSLPQRVFQMLVGNVEPGTPRDVEAIGDAPLAIALMGEGLRRFVALDMPDAALEALEMFFDVVVLEQQGAAVAVIAPKAVRVNSISRPSSWRRSGWRRATPCRPCFRRASTSISPPLF